MAEAKTAASNAYTETPVKSASKTGEAVEEVATSVPTTGGKAKGVGTKVAKEVAIRDCHIWVKREPFLMTVIKSQ